VTTHSPLRSLDWSPLHSQQAKCYSAHTMPGAPSCLGQLPVTSPNSRLTILFLSSLTWMSTTHTQCTITLSQFSWAPERPLTPVHILDSDQSYFFHQVRCTTMPHKHVPSCDLGAVLLCSFQCPWIIVCSITAQSSPHHMLLGSTCACFSLAPWSYVICSASANLAGTASGTDGHTKTSALAQPIHCVILFMSLWAADSFALSPLGPMTHMYYIDRTAPSCISTSRYWCSSLQT
jgi:hypothetical protein